MTVTGIRELEMLKQNLELGDTDHRNGLNDLISGIHVV